MNAQAGETKDPDFVKKNPQATIPFYEENGFHLAESRAIIQYLIDSRAPEKGLLGRFPKQRALIQQRIQYEIGTIAPRLLATIRPLIYEGATSLPEEGLAKLLESFAIVDEFLQKSSYIAGDNVTLADFPYIVLFALFTVRYASYIMSANLQTKIFRLLDFH